MNTNPATAAQLLALHTLEMKRLEPVADQGQREPERQAVERERQSSRQRQSLECREPSTEIHIKSENR